MFYPKSIFLNFFVKYLPENVKIDYFQVRNSMFGRILQQHQLKKQYFLTLFRYNSNISPFFRTKHRHIYIKIFIIFQPTIFMKNNFKLICSNMLKHVESTNFHENLNFLGIFRHWQGKYYINKRKHIVFIWNMYKNHNFHLCI